MDTFVKGELAILQHASYYEEWNGAPAIVVGGLTVRSPMDMHTMETVTFVGYQVLPLVEGAFKVTCTPYQLRKLREPGAEQRREATRRTRTPELVIVR